MRDWHGISIASIADARSRDALATIDEFLQQLSPAITRISRGEMPDSSGLPIIGSNLDALAALTGTGIVRRTGTNAWSVGTTVSIVEGGTGQITSTLAFNALSPLTTLGDVLHHDGTNNARLAIGAAKTFLGSTGTDTAWAIPRHIQHPWAANGPFIVDTSVDGAYVAPTAFTITKAILWRRTAGSSGTTTAVLKNGGSTIDTRTITSANGSNYSDISGTLALAVVAGDKLTVDITTVEAGTPLDFTFLIEGA